MWFQWEDADAIHAKPKLRFLNNETGLRFWKPLLLPCTGPRFQLSNYAERGFRGWHNPSMVGTLTQITSLSSFLFDILIEGDNYLFFFSKVWSPEKIFFRTTLNERTGKKPSQKKTTGYVTKYPDGSVFLKCNQRWYSEQRCFNGGQEIFLLYYPYLKSRRNMSKCRIPPYPRLTALLTY